MNNPAIEPSTAASSLVDSLTMQQIITFCNVYEQGGYANASEVLGLAAPTIWEHIKAIEKIYRAKLFERSGRNIRTTPAGDALYKMLRPILESVISTFDRLAEETEDTARPISIVTGVRMILEELGVPLRRFSQLYPQTCLRLMSADNAFAQSSVLQSRSDLALMIEPSPSAVDSGLSYERLYPIEYLAALPKRHRLSRRSKVTLKDLIHEPLILGNSNTIVRQMFEQARFRLGFVEPLKVVAETDNSAITIACVQAGLGVGIIASRSQGNLTKHVTTYSLTSDLGKVHVVAAYRKGRLPTKAMQTLLNLIREIENRA